MQKPIIVSSRQGSRSGANDLAQRILLKALSEGVTDTNELRKMAGLKSAADVYRTFDKMAMRREYHAALAECGIDFKYLVSGLKKICDNSESEKIKLKALEILLKSLGLDKYDKVEEGGRSWEESIIKMTEGKAPPSKMLEDGDYEVKVPEIPESEIKIREEEKKYSESFYG